MLDATKIKQVTNQYEYWQYIKDWNDPSQSEAKEAHIESMGEEKAVKAAVGAFLESRSQRLTSLINAIPQAQWELRKDLTATCEELLGDFTLLKNNVSPNVFKYVMRLGVGMSITEFNWLASNLDGAKELLGDMFDILVKTKTNDVEIAKSLLKEYRESPEARMKMMAQPLPVDIDGKFVPLITFIQNNVEPKLRAELFAKLELYLESGWAEYDISAELSELEADGQETAMAVRKLIEDAANGSDINPKDIQEILNDRFKVLMQKCKVSYNKESKKLVAKIVERTSEELKSVEIEGSGVIDIFLPDQKDPTLIHLGIVTSDYTTQMEGSQVYRHVDAAIELIKSGALDGVSKVRGTFYVPSTLYGRRPSSKNGKYINSELMDLINGYESENNAVANLMPFIGMVSRVAPNKAHKLADIDLRLVGAPSELWPSLMKDVRAATSDTEKATLFAQQVGKLLMHATAILASGNYDVLDKNAVAFNNWMESYIESVEGFLGICDAVKDHETNRIAKGLGNSLQSISSLAFFEYSSHAKQLSLLEKVVKSIKGHGKKPEKLSDFGKYTATEKSARNQFEADLQELLAIKKSNPHLANWNGKTGNAEIDEKLAHLRNSVGNNLPKGDKKEKERERRIRELAAAGFLGNKQRALYENRGMDI